MSLTYKTLIALEEHTGASLVRVSYLSKNLCQ